MKWFSLICIDKASLGNNVYLSAEEKLLLTGPISALSRAAALEDRGQVLPLEWPSEKARMEAAKAQAARPAAEPAAAVEPAAAAEPAAAGRPRSASADGSEQAQRGPEPFFFGMRQPRPERFQWDEDLDYQGQPVTPAMSVVHLFLAAMRALYGIAG